MLLLPSELEAFGLAALEAMACGVPPVATRTGGVSELVTDGVNGFLEPVGDVAAQAARVVALLTDYVLTVAVSVSSGVQNLYSAFPALETIKLLLIVGLGLIWLIYGNGATSFAFFCMMSGLSAVGLITLVFFAIDWILRHAGRK